MSDTLMHFGKKGMHWGQRNASDKTSRPQKLTRAQVKAEKADFYNKKANNLVAKSLKDPKLLVALSMGQSTPTVITGEEFIQHLSMGGAMDIRYTDVWASKPKGASDYVLNPNVNEQYKRSDGR